MVVCSKHDDACKNPAIVGGEEVVPVARKTIGADPTPPPNGVAPGKSALVKLDPLAAGAGYSAVLKLGVRMS